MILILTHECNYSNSSTERNKNNLNQDILNISGFNHPQIHLLFLPQEKTYFKLKILIKTII